MTQLQLFNSFTDEELAARDRFYLIFGVVLGTLLGACGVLTWTVLT